MTYIELGGPLTPPRPLVDTYVMADERACAACPMNLVCVARKPLMPKPGRVVLFQNPMVCTRCWCIAFVLNLDEKKIGSVPKGSDYPIYLCTLLRLGYWARPEARRASAPELIRAALGLSTWRGVKAFEPPWGCEAHCNHDENQQYVPRAEYEGNGPWDPDHPLNYSELDWDPNKNDPREVMFRLLEVNGYDNDGKYSGQAVMLHEGRHNLQLTLDDCATFLVKQNWAEVHVR